MSPEITPMDPAQVLCSAARALGKFDLYGSPRGITLISTLEIEAMALLLASLGLRPLCPARLSHLTPALF